MNSGQLHTFEADYRLYWEDAELLVVQRPMHLRLRHRPTSQLLPFRSVNTRRETDADWDIVW